MKYFFIFFFLVINELQARPGFPNFNFDTTGAIKQDKVNVIDLLMLKGTSTVLSCDPIFNTEGKDKEAAWYKDGSRIAEVTGQKNAVYENRTLTINNTVPEVGFLIISNLQVHDEGDYWCLRKDTGQIGEISRIRIAFMEEISEDTQLVANPTRPFEGELVEIECASTNAFPVPAISWLLNGTSIPPTSNYAVAPNGSLLIYHYKTSDVGKFECVLTNFAGNTKAGITLSLPLSAPASFQSESAGQSSRCLNIVQNGTLMFLIGCLSTACLVLIYFFGGMIWYRYSNRRPCIGQIPLWRSVIIADPMLAPGFRKVVAPVPDSTRPRLLQTEDI